MENELPEPLRVVVSAVYDVVLAESAAMEDPGRFQHRFFGELTRAEIAMLKQRDDIALPTFRHPLPAMKKYRSFMCGASIYEGLGDAKLRIRDYDILEIRYWHCPYAAICSAREGKICVRTHSLVEAAELLSPALFKEIEELQFSGEGNCQVYVQFDFVGDLREIEQEEKVIDERPCIRMTREQAEAFLLKTFMAGAEYACNHVPELNSRQTLKAIAERIDEAPLDKRYLLDYPFLKRGLGNWRKGKNAFVRSD